MRRRVRQRGQRRIRANGLGRTATATFAPTLPVFGPATGEQAVGRVWLAEIARSLTSGRLSTSAGPGTREPATASRHQERAVAVPAQNPRLLCEHAFPHEKDPPCPTPSSLLCGELASELDSAALLIGLGVRELSVAVPSIGRVKEAMWVARTEGCARLAQRAIDLPDGAAVRSLLSAAAGHETIGLASCTSTCSALRVPIARSPRAA